MATPETIDQQRRVVTATRDDVSALFEILMRLNARTATYNRLGLGDDQILDDDAFVGTGTDKAAYRAAITSLDAIDTLLGAGHGTNLETFAR
jgi:hypothetical protein